MIATKPTDAKRQRSVAPFETANIEARLGDDVGVAYAQLCIPSLYLFFNLSSTFLLWVICLARHIVTTGRRVFCGDPERDHAFVRDVQLRAADLEPFLRRTRALKLDAMAR